MHLILSEILACTLAGSITAAAALAVRSRMKRVPARVKELLWIPVYAGYIIPYALRLKHALWNYPAAMTRAWNSIVHFFMSASPALAAVWLTGLAAAAVLSLLRYIQLSRRVSSGTTEDGVRTSPEADSPITIGLFHPVVILPEGLSEDETHYILMHENAHRRRFDPVKKLLVYCITLLHWFNPFVWYLFSLYETDLEMACDETAAAPLSRSERARYAMTLLYYKPGGITPLINAWKSRDSVMKQRIANITSDRKLDPARRLTAVLCMAGLLLCAFLAPYGTHALAEAKEEALVEVILPYEYLTQNGRWPEDDAEHYLSFFLPESLSRIERTETDESGGLHLYLRESCYERQLSVLEQSIHDRAQWYAENSIASVWYDPDTHVLAVTGEPEDFADTVQNMVLPVYEYEAWRIRSGTLPAFTIEQYDTDGRHAGSYTVQNYDPEPVREVHG